MTDDIGVDNSLICWDPEVESSREPHRADRFHCTTTPEGEVIYEPASRGASNALHEWSDSDWDRTPRTPYERDRDRIFYTDKFRRLKDVTQVARAGESHLYHDRLTHSLKVAQIGRRLAQMIRRRRLRSDGSDTEGTNDDVLDILDPDVVEAACLAHDIGHPPFGHRIEHVLDDLLNDVIEDNGEKQDSEVENQKSAQEEGEEIAQTETDNEKPAGDDSNTKEEPLPFGFEGNAQSLRIVTALAAVDVESEAAARSEYDGTGLFLTRATLCAMLKYPYGKGEGPEADKYGFYNTEEPVFKFARKRAGNEPPLKETKPCLEAQIMDYADDITYAIHDMTDFYMSGHLPLHDLLSEAIKLDEALNTDSSGNQLEDVFSPEIDQFTKYILSHDPNDIPVKILTIEELPSKRDIIELFTDLASYWQNDNTEQEKKKDKSELLTPYQGTPRERRAVDEFTNYLLTKYIHNDEKISGDNSNTVYVTKDDSSDAYMLRYQTKTGIQIWMLRKLTQFHVIQNSTLMSQQRGEEQLVCELFEILLEEMDDINHSAIGEPYQSWLRKAAESDSRWNDDETVYRARIIADMITTMTEPQTIRLHDRLTGQQPGSLQEQIMY